VAVAGEWGGNGHGKGRRGDHVREGRGEVFWKGGTLSQKKRSQNQTADRVDGEVVNRAEI